MNTQKIITPGGETLVVVPLADYERLIDAADIAAADKVRRDIDAGTDELIPAEIANRLTGGENPVRVWREYRGLFAKDVASGAGISTAYLSEIETGKKEGRVSTLKAIADCLGVDIDDLV